MNRRQALSALLWARLARPDSTLPNVILEDAPTLQFPGVDVPERGLHHECDSNSPVHWSGDRVYVFNSYNHAWRSSGTDLFHLGNRMRPTIGTLDNQLSLWIEATWRDAGGTLYGGFHYEPDMICFSNGHLPTVPRIGWLRSADNGASWEDLGFVIDTKPCAVKCETASPWDAGGTGDFVFLPDEEHRYFYFFCTSYDADPAQQGVFAARMRFADRGSPSGKVQKWSGNGWAEPGLGGKITPFFPSQRDYHRPDGSMFWGPAVHYNTHLNMYVMLLNHAIDTHLHADGIFISFSPTLDDPRSWSEPRKLLDITAIRRIMHNTGLSESKMASGWYPQAIGVKPGETDKRLGQTGRFFMAGVSKKSVTFLKPGESR